MAVAAVFVVVVVAVVVLPVVLAVRVAVDHHLAVLAVNLALEAGGPEGGLLRPLLPVDRRMVMYFGTFVLGRPRPAVVWVVISGLGGGEGVGVAGCVAATWFSQVLAVRT